MEMMPRPRFEELIGRLLPPEAREHVLGDLRERLAGAGSPHASQAYLADALRVLPYVVWGQIRRAIGMRMLAVQLATIWASFIAGVFFTPRVPALAFLLNQQGLTRLLIPTSCTFIALVLADTYRRADGCSTARSPVPLFIAAAVAAFVQAGGRSICGGGERTVGRLHVRRRLFSRLPHARPARRPVPRAARRWRSSSGDVSRSPAG